MLIIKNSTMISPTTMINPSLQYTIWFAPRAVPASNNPLRIYPFQSFSDS